MSREQDHKAAAELWANSNPKSSEYSVPTIRLVFLRYATHRFRAAAKTLEGTEVHLKNEKRRGLSFA